jgi:hypothetical protein
MDRQENLTETEENVNENQQLHHTKAASPDELGSENQQLQHQMLSEHEPKRKLYI